ncbi:MAG: hypothetical protein OER95_01830 [Acidimicrobiia bacterium]|nr:hypothetical protein [Acidimicrobiia bacterium]
MTWTAAVLIAISAVLHAGWNFVSKRRSPTLGFFSIAAVSAAVVMLPVLIAHRHLVADVTPVVWGLLAATGLAQGLYVYGLAGAYESGDISLAYPLARALPVLLVAAVGLALGRGDDIGRLGLTGMVLIAIGCVLMPMVRFQRISLSDYRGVVYRMAIVAALDRLGGLVDEGLSQTRVTVFYVSLQAIATALGIALVTMARPLSRHQLRGVLADRRLLRTGVLTGMIISATYGLALAAMAYVSDVSYVAAFRQLSIPIGASLGFILQGEPRYRPKLIGIGVVTLGLVLVGLG